MLRLLPALVLLAGVAARLQTILNPDVAWLLTAAGRMLDGGGYARDFFEINMPWAIAAYIPAQLLARALGLSLAHALTAWIVLLAAHCAWLCLRLTHAAPPQRRPLWAAWLLFTLLLLPLADFGQKEHVIALLLLPFLFLLARPDDAGLPLRVYVTALAAFGLYLKPHFAALAPLLLIAASWRRRSPGVLRSPETLVLLLAAAADAALVLLRYPEWLTCAAWARDVYAAYRALRWDWVLLTPQTGLFAAMALACLWRAWVDAAYRALSWPLLLAALYGAAAYVLQFKGWSYQLLPALLPVSCALGLALLTPPPAAQRLGGALAAAAAALVLLHGVFAYSRLPRASNLAKSNLAPVALALSYAPPHSACYVFTTNMTPAFPTVVLRDLQWASRFPTLWPLPALAGTQLDDRRRGELTQALTASITEDFERYRPSVVMVDLRDDQFGLPRGFDILGFFLRDPRFAQEWKGYEKFGEVDGYDVYRRVADAPRP